MRTCFLGKYRAIVASSLGQPGLVAALARTGVMRVNNAVRVISSFGIWGLSSGVETLANIPTRVVETVSSPCRA